MTGNPLVVAQGDGETVTSAQHRAGVGTTTVLWSRLVVVSSRSQKRKVRRPGTRLTPGKR